MKKAIQIKSLAEDDSLLQVSISATNGQFSGQAVCYTTRSTLAELRNQLAGFPRSIDAVVEFTTGEGKNLSFFSLKFFCVDNAGHVVVNVKICHNKVYTTMPANNEHFMTTFDIPVEAWAIDEFVKTLNRVAEGDVGAVTAELKGKL